MRILTIALLTSLLALGPGTSQAAIWLRNLDDVAHTVTVEEIGGRFDITLEPNQVWRRGGQTMTFILDGGDEMLARGNTEYVIRNNDIYIQRRELHFKHH